MDNKIHTIQLQTSTLYVVLSSLFFVSAGLLGSVDRKILEIVCKLSL